MGTGTDLTQSLSQEIAALKAQLDQRAQEIEAREQYVAKLEHENHVLRKLVFGPRSEKDGIDLSLAAAGRQPLLFVQEIALAAKRLAEEKQLTATVELKSEGFGPRRHGRRKLFPIFCRAWKPRSRSSQCNGCAAARR